MILFIITAVIYVFYIFIYQRLSNVLGLFVYSLIASLFYRGVKKRIPAIFKYHLAVENKDYLNNQYDRYTKKTINMIVLTISVVVYYYVTCFAYGNNSLAEIISILTAQTTIIEIIIFLLLKNIVMYHIFSFYNKDIQYKTKRHFAFITKFTVIYWVIALIALMLLKPYIPMIMNGFCVTCIILAILLIIYNYTQRSKIVYKNVFYNIKRLIIIPLCCVLAFTYHYMRLDNWIMQPYISSVSRVDHNENAIEYDDSTGTYTITKSQDDFKILQLTDIHLGGSVQSASKDLKAIKAVYKLIEYTKPDFVMATGDLVFPLGIMSYSLNNNVPVTQFASFMSNIGIPWAFVYGNHDTEMTATYSKEELDELFKSVSFKTTKNLLYPYTQPPITGRNNQIIKINNQDGSLNQVLFFVLVK